MILLAAAVIGCAIAWVGARLAGMASLEAQMFYLHAGRVKLAREQLSELGIEVPPRRPALPPAAPPALPAAQPPIADGRLRQIALGVRSRVHPTDPALSHITGVTAAEVTEMAVAFAAQRGIELRSKP